LNKLLSIILFFVLSSFVFGQVEPIPWSEQNLLTWHDFQGDPPKRHYASAMSDINFTVEMSSEGDILMVFVAPSFNPSGSWVKPDDKTDYLLKHEQIHFDIYELNARKLRSELSEKELTSKNAQSTINKLMEKYNKLNVSVQENYDLETEHSIKVDKQKKWNAKIAKELIKYAEFSSPSFEMKIEMDGGR